LNSGFDHIHWDETTVCEGATQTTGKGTLQKVVEVIIIPMVHTIVRGGGHWGRRGGERNGGGLGSEEAQWFGSKLGKHGSAETQKKLETLVVRQRWRYFYKSRGASSKRPV
jgi:hypothetical protein